MIYKFYQQRVFPHILNQVMQLPSMMDSRRKLLLPIQGEVLEIGFGTGINLPFYQAVDTLYALEPSESVFALALQRIKECPFHVKHIASKAEQLPFENESLKHVVSTWTLCSVSDVQQVLAEIKRVLEIGGTLHLVEHVAYDAQNHKNLKRLQDLLTPVQKVIADGCHLNRNIELALNQAGFEISEIEYFEAEEVPQIGRRMMMARAVRTA